MRPFFLALLCFLHALAHAGAGMWATGRGTTLLVTGLWLVAMCGFMATAFAILGLEPLQPYAERLCLAATIASALLLRLSDAVALWAVGMLVGVILCVLVRWWARCTHPEIHTATVTTMTDALRADAPTTAQRVAATFAYALLLVTAGLIVARPWYQSWGSTAAERGDALRFYSGTSLPRYRSDHAVTIGAPADRVWPWLAQLGQDRAGFYSYDWLERAVGDDVHNADSLVPQWQQRQVGDLVRATQPDFFGGRLGNALGWRITQWDPPRSMSLENWGTFVVTAIDDSTSRLRVHTLGDGRPSFGALSMAWLGFYLFEPVHFVMERGMLLGIKQRAERENAAPR